MRYRRVPVAEEDPTRRAGSFDEVLHPYTRRQAVLEANRCLQCALPYCVEACPIGQDCRGYIGAIADGRFDDAARIVLQANPLATTLCKVCYHFCEPACSLGGRGTPVAIRQLKRAAMEYGRTDLRYVPGNRSPHEVAIIGAGPAGLMAAWELALRGYGVTVFEKEKVVGGQAEAIPHYRLPGSELLIDLERLGDLGIRFCPGVRAGGELDPAGLLRQGFSAVYVAIGTSKSSRAGVPGEELPGVLHALDFLLAVNADRAPNLGQRIVVIGGGDVAIDAVRSARRLAPRAAVTLLYRRGREEAPAGEEELREAEPERIEFRWWRAPVRVLGTDRVTGLEVRPMQLGPADRSGRRSVVPVDGPTETLDCDTVIVATGQSADLTGFPEELGLSIGSKGWPEGRRPDTMTGLDGVFASGGRSVVHAMAAGVRSAEAIDRYLRHRDGQPPSTRPDPFGDPEPPPRFPSGYTGPAWTP